MKLISLDLFSGYGGITLALENYARPIMYCEIEKYAQGILLSRMDDGTIPFAPIWGDVTTLDGTKLKGMVDIIYGGFPCQDISVAGKQIGLEGKRSGLFYEIARLVEEIRPSYIFLENVPNIRTKGAIEVQEKLSELGYDSRWTTLSASEVGANHKRERWFCLAYANDSRCNTKEKHEAIRIGAEEVQERENTLYKSSDEGCFDPNPLCKGLERQREKPFGTTEKLNHACYDSWWKIEPSVGRMVNGLIFQSHRIKALGNGVVPLQVKTAFEYLLKGI